MGLISVGLGLGKWDQTVYNEDVFNDQNIEEINISEDYYDFHQSYLNALLNSVSRESIKEVWRIIPYTAPNSYQHIIILNDGTCLLLVSSGIICRHYFKLMVENQHALFHIMLIPSRWLHDNAWKTIDFIYSEPFINASSQNFLTNNHEQILNPRHYNNVQEVQIQCQVQKKLNYSRIMGHFKQALNYSLDDDDEKNLDDMILSYIAKKVEECESRCQTATEESQPSNNTVKLHDGRVYNVNDVKDPTVRQGKGNAPKCPNKENA
ncbi:hypothetical protein C1645_807950 [Glomus cerebriforme]|uniref:SWIM-type domain-containing protein n=1 Tax=Glomus cerebriforme TaxID=658196 RepID=A0A397SMH5_9GLOM|nr:hypothetical protein C1645_807950 [Glomus cerebriforme]